MLQYTKLIHRNLLLLYTLITKDQKEIKEIIQVALQQKEYLVVSLLKESKDTNSETARY